MSRKHILSVIIFKKDNLLDNIKYIPEKMSDKQIMDNMLIMIIYYIPKQKSQNNNLFTNFQNRIKY